MENSKTSRPGRGIHTLCGGAFVNSWLYAALLAAGLGLIIMLPSMLRFDGVFIIRGDYVDQFINRLLVTKRMITQGGSWSWSEFMGTPYTAWERIVSFDSISLLFPERLIPYTVFIGHTLRFFTMAATSYTYIAMFVKNRRSATAGALLYTFSSFAVICFEFMQFLNTMAVFPLLLIAAERKFTSEKRSYLLIFAAFINAYVDFYLFIGSTMIFFIYCLIRFIGAPEWRARRCPSAVLSSVAEYATGVFLAGISVVPFIFSMLSTKKSTDNLGRAGGAELLKRLNLKELLVRLRGIFTPGASNRFNVFYTYTRWCSNNAYVPVFGFAFCLAYIKKFKLKNTLSLLLLTLLLISAVPLLNDALILYTNDVYTRWWYILTLICVLITAVVIDRYDELEKKHIRFGMGVCAAYAVYLPFEVFLIIPFLKTNPHTLKVLQYFKIGCSDPEGEINTVISIFALVCLGAFTALAICFCCFRALRRHVVPVLSAALAVYTIAYLQVNNTSENMFDYAPRAILSLERDVELHYLSNELDNPTPDEYRYRIDHPMLLNNYGCSLNMSSLQCFTSYLEKDMADFAYGSGSMRSSPVRFRPSKLKNSLRALTSAKYYYNFCPDDEIYGNVPQGFTHERTAQNGVEIYTNDYYIPMGFAYDKYITSQTFRTTKDADTELMLNALVVNEDDAEFVSDLLTLGTGHTEDYDEVIRARRGLVCEDFVGTSRGFTAKCTADKESVIFFSVPYNENWHGEINGRECEYIRANLSFMAIRVPAGESLIEFTYSNPAPLLYGASLSGCGALICAVYVTSGVLLDKRRRGAESGKDEGVKK